MREELVFSHRASALLHFNFVLIAALVIYCWFKLENWAPANLSGLWLYLAIALSLLVIYIVKLLFNGFLILSARNWPPKSTKWMGFIVEVLT